MESYNFCHYSIFVTSGPWIFFVTKFGTLFQHSKITLISFDVGTLKVKNISNKSLPHNPWIIFKIRDNSCFTITHFLLLERRVCKSVLDFAIYSKAYLKSNKSWIVLVLSFSFSNYQKCLKLYNQTQNLSQAAHLNPIILLRWPWQQCFCWSGQT